MKKHPGHIDINISANTTHDLLIETQPLHSHAIAHGKQTHSVVLSYGRCSQCSCPGFIGSSYTCARSGCGHHYDEHG